MFFNIGSGEMLLIAVALLLAVGPEQLPGLVRRIGSAVGQFRSISERLRADFTAGMEELDRAADVKHWTDVPTPNFTGRDPAADSARPPNRSVPPADAVDETDTDSSQQDTAGDNPKQEAPKQEAVPAPAVPEPDAAPLDVEGSADEDDQ